VVVTELKKLLVLQVQVDLVEVVVIPLVQVHLQVQEIHLL
tara:strand:+ start:276 stop:395 length:120 start_codon:yes stop_codon:yes gene_type:complete